MVKALNLEYLQMVPAIDKTAIKRKNNEASRSCRARKKQEQLEQKRDYAKKSNRIVELETENAILKQQLVEEKARNERLLLQRGTSIIGAAGLQ